MHSPEKVYEPAPIQVKGKIPSNLALHLASGSTHGNNTYMAMIDMLCS